jgi:hypothetical protein
MLNIVLMVNKLHQIKAINIKVKIAGKTIKIFKLNLLNPY